MGTAGILCELAARRNEIHVILHILGDDRIALITTALDIAESKGVTVNKIAVAMLIVRFSDIHVHIR
jgi:hypothetical protein